MIFFSLNHLEEPLSNMIPAATGLSIPRVQKIMQDPKLYKPTRGEMSLVSKWQEILTQTKKREDFKARRK